MSDKIVDTALYEADAADARRRIALTVGEIRHRLDPRTIANEAIDAATERGAQLVARGRQAARDNLGAISIVGALAGMMAGARHYRKDRKAPAMSEYEDDFGNEAPGKDRLESVKQTAQQVRETVTHKAQAAREAAGETFASARQHANDAWETARERAATDLLAKCRSVSPVADMLRTTFPLEHTPRALLALAAQVERSLVP